MLHRLINIKQFYQHQIISCFANNFKMVFIVMEKVRLKLLHRSNLRYLHDKNKTSKHSLLMDKTKLELIIAQIKIKNLRIYGQYLGKFILARIYNNAKLNFIKISTFFK